MLSHCTARLRQTMVWLTIITLLTACGGGNNDLPTNSSSDTQTISGSIIDGPISNADITVKDANGNIVLTTTGSEQAFYSIEIATNAPRPLTIIATGGTDMVTNSIPKFTLTTVVGGTENQTANISSFSTFIVETAKTLPNGLTAINIETAKTHVLSQLNFGWDNDVIPDPIVTPIDDSNIAYIVKSSEALAEMLRRVYSDMTDAGSTLTHEQIIESLAQDLSDGKIDGQGAGNIDGRLAAIANIVAGQVLLESFQNELNVKGSDATLAMDNAIKMVFPLASMTTEAIPVTAAALTQKKQALKAAQTLAASSELTVLSRQINDINAGDSSLEVRAILDTNAAGAINTVLNMVRAASDTEIDAMNETVRRGNNHRPPTLSGTPYTEVFIDSLYIFSPKANDPDGEDLAFSIQNKPTWATFDNNTGELSGTPTSSDIGITSEILISVTNSTLSTSLPVFSISVLKNNSAPSINGTPASIVFANSEYNFEPIALDADGDTLIFSINGKPDWAEFNVNNGALTGVPTVSDVGISHNIQISASDRIDIVNLPVFNITVAQNNAPVLTGTPSTTVYVGSNYRFKPDASDPDGDLLAFSITNLPSWMEFNANTGELTGKPVAKNEGTETDIEISVTDGRLTTLLLAFNLSVTIPDDENNAPTLGGSPATTVRTGSEYRFLPISNDTDGDTLIFSISNTPNWASFDIQTGELTGTPTSEGTTENIVISVSDNIADASLPAFSITVNKNHAPTIEGTPITSVLTDSAYTFIPTANDEDSNDTLTFSIVNPPDWAQFNTTTGELSGTPNSSQKGISSAIVISVSDKKTSTSLPTFNITVEEDTSPIARNDSTSTDRSLSTIISVLDNDDGLDNSPVNIGIFQPPTNGNVEVLPDNRIEYTPDGVYTGNDNFIYQVSDADADFSTAVVTIQVTCDSCENNLTSIELSWNPNPAEENVIAYTVFYGNSAGMNLPFFKKLTSADIDLSGPVFSLEAQEDLNAEEGDNVCFQISATNRTGESAKTSAICTTI